MDGVVVVRFILAVITVLAVGRLIVWWSRPLPCDKCGETTCAGAPRCL